MNYKLILNISVIFLLLSGCTKYNDPIKNKIGSYKNYYSIDGKIKNNIYYAKNNMFKFNIPSLLKPGASIEDNYTSKGMIVQFEDDAGRFITIHTASLDLFPKNSTHNNILKNADKLIYLLVFKQWEKDFGIKAKLIYSKLNNNKMYIIYDFPKGSTFIQNKQRVNAVMVSVVFIKNNNLIMLTRQSSQHFLEYKAGYNNIENLISLIKKDYNGFK